MVDGNEEVAGDITFHIELAENAKEAKTTPKPSQAQSAGTQGGFLVVTLDDEIGREMREAFRSEEMIKRKTRGATTADETALIAEEKVRQRAPCRNCAAGCAWPALGEGFLPRQRPEPVRRAGGWQGGHGGARTGPADLSIGMGTGPRIGAQ